MNLPNKISLVRILFIPVFMFFIVPLPEVEFLKGFNEFARSYGSVVAGIIYILASITDSIDGHIARSRNLVTNFGKFIDPVADKLLVTAALLSLVQNGQLSGWFAFIIIGRELLVTGFRLIASDGGIVIAANKLGKLKMVFQTVAVTWMLFEPSIQQFYFWNSGFKPGYFLMIIAVILTAASGYVYIKDNLHLIKNDF